MYVVMILFGLIIILNVLIELEFLGLISALIFPIYLGN